VLDRQIIEAEIAKLTDIIEQPLAQSSPPIFGTTQRAKARKRSNMTGILADTPKGATRQKHVNQSSNRRFTKRNKKLGPLNFTMNYSASPIR
jgi:hypothetical protein